MIRTLNRQSTGKGKYEIYQEQIRKTERQIAQYTERKAELYQDYAERLISEEDYVAIGQDYGKKTDELKIYLAELNKEIQKYSSEFIGSERWERMIEEYKNQDVLSRDMVEAFIDNIVAYNDGRVEISLRHKDELESVLYQVAERKKEGMRCAM